MGAIVSRKRKQKVEVVTMTTERPREPAGEAVSRSEGQARLKDPPQDSGRSSDNEKESETDDQDDDKPDENGQPGFISENDDDAPRENHHGDRSPKSGSVASEDNEALEIPGSPVKNDEPETTESSASDEFTKMWQRVFLEGLGIKISDNVKIVRIFTSSTFTDTSVERNTLMERVYPRLKSYCQERGYDFQVVDMRWGVRDESTDDHMTTELCMRELRACQKFSTGPNFITFLGQKYGYRPFPPKIAAPEFEKLLSAVDNEEDLQLLKRWFWRDDNAVPAQYLLQPITSLLPHYRNYENNDLRKKASAEWWTAFERMQIVLRKAADKALEKDDRHRYHMSVTENEIRCGIMTALTPEKHCFWFKRTITDLNENSHKPNAGKFLDKCYGDNDSTIDEPAQNLLNTLREQELPKALPHSNVIQYNVSWSNEGIDPGKFVEHTEYLNSLCGNVYDVLSSMIQEGIKEKGTLERRDPLEEEILQHALFCQRKGLACQGRDDFLHSVRSSLLGNENQNVVVLHGESGCGKTSIMARIAVEAKEKWLGDESAIVVLRFIGTSPSSSSIRPLLISICQQLCKTTEMDLAEIPQDLIALIEFFPKCLEEACTSRPVVLVIDSLDQLSAEDGGTRLDWLPSKLPDNAYLVLSTLPGLEYGCLPNLQAIFPDVSFMEVPIIPVTEAGTILENWLRSSRRKLVDFQKQLVLEAFKECPLPLFLKLSFDDACRWKSYTQLNETKVASSVKGIINDLFELVERRHGKVLVSHALAYLTASKNGLTEPELEDVLSLDDDVLNDVYQYWTPPVRRLPPLLWIRIRSDIEDYLIERGSDDVRVISWYHRQFVEVAAERYLGTKEVVIHSRLADFFLGTWSAGTAKPFITKDGQQLLKDRLVAKQPLIFDATNEMPIFNLRKLNELPHHLLHSNDLKRLKGEVLCNFEFLLAKLRATSLEAVLDDVSAALSLYPDDSDSLELEKALQLSSAALKSDNNQLAPQLLARLLSRSGREEFHGIQQLLLQAYSSTVPCLVPSHTCLTSPGGSLISSLKAPGESITNCCGFSCDGQTAYIVSTAKTMALHLVVVNLHSGKYLRRLTLPASLNLGLTWTVHGSNVKEDHLLLAGSENIFLFNVTAGQVVKKFAALAKESQYTPMPPVSFADSDMRIVAITDEDLKIWTVEDGQLEHQIDIGKIPTDEEYGSLGVVGYWVAFSVHGSKYFQVFNARTGVEVRKVEVFKPGDACSIAEVKITSREQVVVTSSERNNLLLYDLHAGSLIREISQFRINKGLLRLQLTTDGTKVLSVNDFEVLITDLDDGTIRKTLKSKSFGTFIIHLDFLTKDGKFAVSISHDELIRIYNLERAIAEDEDKPKDSSDSKAVASVDSITFLNSGNDDRHVIATALVNNSNQVLIWDTWRGKTVRALQVAQELPPSTLRMCDAYRAVGYIHDQTFLHFKVFDFKAGRIERCLKGRASKRTEAFGIVDEKRVIAFSRGRRNLKVWDIDKGTLVQQHKFGQQHRLEDMLISKNGKAVVCSQVSQIVTHTEETLPLISLNTETGDHKFLQVQKTQLLLWNASIADNGHYLVCLTKEFTPVLWNLRSGEVIHKLRVGEYHAATATAISTTGNVALTGHSDGDINVWDIQSGSVNFTFKCETVASIFVTQDGKIAFSNYRYSNSNIDAWDLKTGLRLATFTSDWKPERLAVSGNRLVVAKADGPELMTLRTHIPGCEEKLPEEMSPFEGCPVDGVLKATEESPQEEDDDDDDADDDQEVTDIQRTEFTKKAVHAKPNVIIGGGSTVFAAKNVFISEKVFRDNFT